MKKVLFFLSLSLCGINCANTVSTSQPIQNADFEDTDAATHTKPKHWHITPVDHYQVSLDSTTYYKGNRSLRISNIEHTDAVTYQNFSQYCDYTTARTKRITVTAYVKTQNVKGSVGLWCQLLDSTNKMLGYADLMQQNTKIDGTHEWAQYSLMLIVNTQVKHLNLGGNLSGEGTAWFDHFEIEDANDTTHNLQVTNYMKEVEQTIKANSLYKDSINWPQLDNDLYELSGGVDSISKSSFLVSYAVKALTDAGDNHSFYQPKMAAKYTGQKNETTPFAQYVENNIGYINIPGFLSGDDTSSIHFATSIQEMIKNIDINHNIKGWIVDLRSDYGGNMYPMVAGLSPLLGSGTWWYFFNNASYEPWSYEKVISTTVKLKSPYTLRNKKIKIAVLIGPHTASSGEMTAISFIGKQNSKLFGQESEGYITTNSTFPLSDGSVLNLATGYIADRNKKIYKSKLTPDFFITPDAPNSNEDATLDAAKKWIMQ